MSENEWSAKADKLAGGNRPAQRVNPRIVSKALGRPNDYPNRSLKDGSIKRIAVKLELETVALIHQATSATGSHSDYTQNRLVNQAVQDFFGPEAVAKVRKDLLKKDKLTQKHIG